MSIPTNITKSHLLQAIEKIDQEGIPKDADSQYYDVLYNGKRYPPKLIVSYANLFANGEILDRNSFAGGLNTPCFKLLEDNEFNIVPKSTQTTMSYFKELTNFIAQAETGVLGTASYLNTYQDLKVKVSFGQGNAARIPWIAFLKPGQTVPDGIYPVYLYYKELKLLILAYGVSETKKPQINWDLENGETIADYFSTHNLNEPQRYGSSYVFKVYNTNEQLKESEVINDLNDLIEKYKQVLKDTASPKKVPSNNTMFNHSLFTAHTRNAHLFIHEKTASRFIASLLTKPFVILTGLSGSGKTKLAQVFASWICETPNQFCIVPVGADWTNREPLLGFPNALKPNDYVKPDNQVLDLIIAANNNLDKPYFLILDEMNLSHVERYFADFLSVMESKNTISLHAGNENWNGVPAQVGFPKNLFIIGTVNIDETTYMFSPKVLDRANVIEFRVTPEEMKTYLEQSQSLNLNNLIGLGANMGSSFVEMANEESLGYIKKDELNTTLFNFFIELKKAGAEFGYRTAAEILRFAAVANKLDSNWTLNEIIDAAIMQKLLPKVHGSRRKLEPILKMLGSLCLMEGQTFEAHLKKDEERFVKYPISMDKIIRMYDNLLSNGFTSYAEA